ncbi:hypothetical protein [Aureivirga sp. CE67]|uniref:hypothetical protein n=1 Tax=Aureivirga sp. CE67 TaxID=1788983 RepID=UPI0018CB6E50|nr:hypothetical protein [Aureivirga sp. CE67]
MKKILLTILTSTLFFACSSDESSENTSVYEPKLIIKLKVDSEQIRLGNTGEPEEIPENHAAQNPNFNKISAHYLEFSSDKFTALGSGEILFHAPETTQGGENAIDFNKSNVISPNETFLEIPLKSISEGNYNWVRLSVSYQNYDINFQYNNQQYQATLASFVGYNTFIESFLVKNETLEINENKKQGFFAFETINGVQTGQAPENATTVPNPLFETSPIPQGSCVVTGNFGNTLEINGNETEDIIIELFLSTNKSFEWIDINNNGQWDVDIEGEKVVNMGLRGLIPIVK